MAEKVVVIIPAYNEEKQIQKVILSVHEVIPEADIVIVDDGSRDSTSVSAREAGAIVLKHPFNMGYGVALQTGYKYAARHHYDFVVQMDADGQHEPKCIPDLLDAVKDSETDIVLGSRWLGMDNYQGPLLRKFGKFFFGFLASLLTKYKVTDPTTGFQALSKSVVNFFCSYVYPADYPDADVIIMLHRADFKVREIPVVMYRDESGQSMHSGLKPLYYGIKMMMSIIMTLLRDDRHLRNYSNYG